jgi:hypothetical protein
VEVLAVGVDEAFHVVDEQVLLTHAQGQEEPGAARADGARPAEHDPHGVDALRHELQRVEQGRGGHHGRAVEILVEDGNAHPLAQAVVDRAPRGPGCP